MKKIYIVHQYLDENHFKALYECARNYGYEIEDYYVLDKFYIFKNIVKKELFKKKLGLTFREGLDYLKKQGKLKNLKNEIIIVGLAPYDGLLNKYQDVFSNNKCVYFSSWQTWDGSDFPRGSIKNRRFWEKKLSELFVAAACVSKKTATELNRFIDRTFVVNHALAVDEYRKKNDLTRKSRFLFFGRFEDNKNMKYMIDWLKENPDLECKFDFAGFGSYQGDIEHLAQSDSRVSYLGLLDKTEIKNILCEYDFIVLPSKFEPFGISLIEALAAGVPCLTSTASGPMEIIEDGKNGIICDKDSYESFTECMNRALTMNSTEYLKLCKNALLSGNEYSAMKIAKKWCQIFDKIK